MLNLLQQTCKTVATASFAFFIALSAQSAIGIAPVLSRFLQVQAKLPSFSINALANALSLIVYTPVVFGCCIYGKCAANKNLQEKIVPSTQQELPDTTTVAQVQVIVTAQQHVITVNEQHVNNDLAKQQDEASRSSSETVSSTTADSQTTTTQSIKDYATTIVVTISIVTTFCVCRVGKNVCNLLASKFTSSINTQLVSLTSPFMVTAIVLSTKGIYVIYIYCTTPTAAKQDGEQPTTTTTSSIVVPFNWKMALCMLIATGGAILIVMGRFSMVPNSFTWTLTVSQFADAANWTLTSIAGISLSLLSACLGSIYSILTAFVTTSGDTWIHKHNRFQLSNVNLNYFQTWLVFLFSIILSFALQENWNIWLHLDGTSWGLFVAYAIISYVVGEILVVMALNMLGSLAFNALLPTSLCVTVLFSWILLNELLTNFWLILGCAIAVSATVGFLICRGLLLRHLDLQQKMKKVELENKEQPVAPPSEAVVSK